MRKLRLGIENLRVESFETGAGEESRGTVHANASHFCTRGGGVTCQGGYTCDPIYYTCGGDTCQHQSCDGVCGTYYCGSDPSCGYASCLGTCAPELTCELGCQ